MIELPELTIEVRKERLSGTRVVIFHTQIHAGGNSRVVIEDHSSQEHLDEFLLGVSQVLDGLGYFCPSLHWPYPETFGEPSGRRWRLQHGVLPDLPEELSSAGQVIRA